MASDRYTSTVIVPTEEDTALLHWLRANGAKIDKVKWPAASAIDGVRGAGAIQGDTSLSIILHLM